MNAAAAGRDDVAGAELHATLRFAVSVTVAFVACEVMEWAPTSLGAVLAAVLLGNIPMRPPLKMAVVLVLTMAVTAVSAYLLTDLLRAVPPVLFGMVGLAMFLAFHAMVSGGPFLPSILLLICLATIPVVELVAPTAGASLARALPRSIAVALVVINLAWLVWPRMAARAPAPAPAPSVASSLARALLSTAVVLPVMLVYLLFGLADVLAVLIGTLIIVINFDPAVGRKQAVIRVVANFAGGLLAFIVHSLLLTTPSAPFLALLLFVVMLGFGRIIHAGGPTAAAAVVACNGMLIVLSSAIASGPSTLSLWLVRLFQFALAGAFAVGMMELLWHWVAPRLARRVSQ